MALSTHHLRRRVEQDFNARMLAGGVLTLNEARGFSVYRPEAQVHGVMPGGVPVPRSPTPPPPPMSAMRVASRHAVVSRAGFGGGFPRTRGVWR